MRSKTRTPRIYICIDQNRVWEVYSEIPIEVIVQDNNNQEIRYSDVVIDEEFIQEKADIAMILKKIPK